MCVSGPLTSTSDGVTLIEAGLPAGQKFTAAPKPLDPRVPSSLLDDLVFKKIMYTQQKRYEEQMRKLGITDDDDYTCACYLDQVGNTPKKGDVLSWAESSAVVYANSVLGARCNRNSGMIELMGSIAGFVPEFGLLTDEGRKAGWVVELRCQSKPEAQLLGSAIGMKVMEEVPYVKGLDAWLGNELNDEAKAYLKDFGAATASNGAVGLYHIAEGFAFYLCNRYYVNNIMLLGQDLDEKQREHDKDDRAGDLRALLEGEARADPAPQHVAGRPGETEGDQHRAAVEKDREGGEVRREIDDLGVRVRGLDAEMGEDGKGDNEEGPGAGAVKAVVEADDQRGQHTDAEGPAVGGGLLAVVFGEEAAIQDDEGGEREHDKEDAAHHLLVRYE